MFGYIIGEIDKAIGYAKRNHPDFIEVMIPIKSAEKLNAFLKSLTMVKANTRIVRRDIARVSEKDLEEHVICDTLYKLVLEASKNKDNFMWKISQDEASDTLNYEGSMIIGNPSVLYGGDTNGTA